MAAGFKVGNWISQGVRLGSGSFATVYAGTHAETGREVAIKVMDLTRLTGQIGPSTPENRAANTAALQRLAAEIKLQMVCNSPYTVPLIEVFTANENLYLVMERCWGDLRKLLLTFGGRFSESTTRRLMRQLALGYMTLYEQKIVHRDLKPQNLLVCFDPPECVDPDHAVVKISDFGFAKLLDDKKDEVTGTLCGSPLYMAPEIFRQPPSYNAKADLYSIGAIMMELLTGRAPYPLPAIAAIIEVHRFQTHLPVPIPDSLVQEASPSCLDLLRRLLHKSPVTRLSFAEFFEHPWLDLAAFRSSLAPSPPQPVVVMPPSPSPSPSPPPVAVAPGHPSSSDSAINCQELIDTLRSIERSLPGLPAEESIFDKPLTADTMAIFAARMADFVDDFRSLSAENQRLRSDQRRKIVGSDFLQPGDGAMFFWADGGYKAYGRSFQHRYVLSPDSFSAFKDEINRKNVVFGTVERLVPRVETSTVEVVLQPWTAKPRSSEPSSVY